MMKGMRCLGIPRGGSSLNHPAPGNLIDASCPTDYVLDSIGRHPTTPEYTAMGSDRWSIGVSHFLSILHSFESTGGRPTGATR